MKEINTSSYLISVKLDSEEDKYMLIHGYTGAMDIVSSKVLSAISSTNTDRLSNDTIQFLLKRGYFTTWSKEEEYAHIVRLANALQKKHKILYSTFTWVITYNCNFRCPYCFEGREKKDGKAKIVFTKDRVDKAFNEMEIIQPQKELRRDVITLYGGEPLLSENKEIINYIVQEGCKRGYRFVVITNGYSIDEFMDLFLETKIYKLQITVDGSKEVHNVRRIHKDGYGTFDKIIDNIKLALSKDVHITVRMNVDGKNIEQYNELMDYFKSNSFFKSNKFYFYPAILENSVNVTSSEKEQLDFVDDKTFFEAQKDVSEQITSHYIYSIFIKSLSEGKAISFRSVSCAAQVNGYVLDPLGGIYPCWDTIGDKKHLMGNYFSGKINWNKKVLENWQNTNVGQIRPCNKCKYAILCGGGCPYRHISKANSHCKMFEEILKTAINKAYDNFSGKM